MAQQVDVKGFGLVEFPDNIERSVMLDALRRKFSQINQGQAVANSTAEPYNPGLAERAASAISSGLQKTGLISDNYRANRIGDNITMGLEALPVIGDAIGGDELGRAIREGDVIGGGFAALGAIPIAGDAAKAAGRDVKEALSRFGDSGVKSAIRERDDLITLDKVIVPQEQRGSGVGTDFMQSLLRYSDEKGVPVALTPSSDFGGNKARLTEFYKRFGFVENKGKNKRYEISEAMYRDPQQNPMLQVGGKLSKDDAERWQFKTNQLRNKSKPETSIKSDYGNILVFDESDDSEMFKQMVLTDSNGDAIATLFAGEDAGRMVGSIEVRPDMRRKGIATKLYDEMEKLTGLKMKPADKHSKDAEAFWKSRRGNK